MPPGAEDESSIASMVCESEERRDPSLRTSPRPLPLSSRTPFVVADAALHLALPHTQDARGGKIHDDYVIGD